MAIMPELEVLSSSSEAAHPIADDDGADIIYPSAIPFALLHLSCLGTILTGVTAASLWLCLGLYCIRMFAIGAAYHRYFSHRSFSTSRWFQFVLALLAQSSAQKSVLWWAAKHRHHHLHADTAQDTHSPAQHGFLYAHLGWIFSAQHQSRDLTKVKDLAAFPELLWLDRFEVLPAVALAGLSFVIAGWPGLSVGFVWSTVALFHATFAINSLAHTSGSRRYATGDDSRNNWLLALLTFGEGWHNNHHAFQSSARQGFRWWEVDPTFYCLKALALTGLIWNLKAPPLSIIRNEQRLSAGALDKIASKLATSFALDGLRTRVTDDIEGRAGAMRLASPGPDHLEERLLALLPSRGELRQRASVMFAKTRSLDEVIEKAHALLKASLLDSLKKPLTA